MRSNRRDSESRRRDQLPPRSWDDYHDPTAGIGGAPPARSDLTLRLWLALIGLGLCLAGIAASIATGASLVFPVVLGVLAVVGLVDIAVVIHRRRVTHILDR